MTSLSRKTELYKVLGTYVFIARGRIELTWHRSAGADAAVTPTPTQPSLAWALLGAVAHCALAECSVHALWVPCPYTDTLLTCVQA